MRWSVKRQKGVDGAPIGDAAKIVKMTEESVFLAKKHLLTLRYTLEFDADILDDEAKTNVENEVEELSGVIEKWTNEDTQMHNLVTDIEELENTLAADGDLMEEADKTEMQAEIEKKTADHMALMVARLDAAGKITAKKEVRAKINSILSEELEELKKEANMMTNLLEMDSELLTEEERDKLQDELNEKLSELLDIENQINEEKDKEDRKEYLQKDLDIIDKTREFDGDIADEGDLDDEYEKTNAELAAFDGSDSDE